MKLANELNQLMEKEVRPIADDKLYKHYDKQFSFLKAFVNHIYPFDTLPLPSPYEILLSIKL